MVLDRLRRGATGRDPKKIPDGLWEKCPSCQKTVFKRLVEERLDTCPECNHHFKMTAPRRIASLIDDGTWHSTFTDLQVTVNYQLINGAFGLAPYVGALIPTHDYTTFGHAAPGRGLNEVWIGTYAGMSLNEWIPRTYVQVRAN